MDLTIETDWEKNNIYNQTNSESLNNNANNKKKNSITKYIFVLAGGLKENGEVNNFVQLRLDKAIELYKKHILKGFNCKIFVFGGGTYHKPPFLNESNYVIHESTSCAYYLNQFIDETNIYREWSSYDTIANGYYAFLNFILPLEIKEFTLITSEFHMERSMEIFKYFNKICTNNKSKISFISTQNIIEEEIFKIRKERERNSLENFKTNIVSKIKNLKDFTEWFYQKHNAYKAIIHYKENKKINNTY